MRRFFMLLLVVILSGCSLTSPSEPESNPNTESGPAKQVTGVSTSQYVVFGRRGKDQGVYAADIAKDKPVKEIYKGGYTYLHAIKDRVMIFAGKSQGQDGGLDNTNNASVKEFEDGIFIISDFAGKVLKTIRAVPEVDERIRPVLSPDGKRIIYISNKNGVKSVCHIDVEGSKIEKVDELKGDIRHISFKNKDEIIYTKYKGSASQIYEFNLRLYIEKKVIESEFRDSSPCLSADGTKLAFIRNKSGRKDLYIRSMASDDERPQEIYIREDVVEDSIKWSEGNRFISFEAGVGNQRKIMLYEIYVGNFNELSDAFSSVFSINGDFIAYTEYKPEKGAENKSFKQYIYTGRVKAFTSEKIYEAEEESLFGKSIELLQWTGEI